ncbi:CHAT domain-containing protein [Sphingomonadaceae bacterium OTU29MARTA1]|nr:CHAT domain-containing protein [Sphingomonadaceae bacterium OTU29MARTA1]
MTTHAVEIARNQAQRDAASAAGEHQRARVLSTQILALMRESSGKTTSEYAAALSAHALILNALNQNAEAARVHGEALTVRTSISGERDPRTLSIMHNLAYTLNADGRSVEAEPLYQKVYALRRAVLGEDHADTLISLSNLATCLHELGRTAVAEPLQRELLRLRIATLGEKDPRTLRSYGSLAVMLRTLGKVGDAEATYRRILPILIETKGEKNADTLAVLNNLAIAINRQGRAKEAETFARQALMGRSQLLGERHPDTFDALSTLASALVGQGRYREVEPIQRHILAQRVETLGDNSPATLSALANLASNLNEQARFTEAETMFRRVYERRKKMLGDMHPKTIASLDSLGLVLDELGRSEDAEPLLRRAYMQGEQVLGNNHPDTLITLGNLASTLRTLGRFAEAETFYARAAELGARIRTDDHPSTLFDLRNLADARLWQPERASLALAPARAAVAGWRRRRAALNFSAVDEAQLARDTEQQRYFFVLLADAAWAAADAAPPDTALLKAEAFRAIQEAMSGPAGKAVAMMGARAAVDNKRAGLGTLASRRERLTEAWRNNDAAQTAVLSDNGSAAIRSGKLREQQNEIEAAISKLDIELRAQAPEYFSLIRPTPLTIRDARKLLKAHEAVMLFLPGQHGTHVMTVTRDSVSWIRSDMDQRAIGAAVARLRCDLDPDAAANVSCGAAPLELGAPAGDEPAQSYDRQTAWRLYQTLIAPFAAELSNKNTVFIAAEGALASLPFSTLVSARPNGKDQDPTALRATHWFGDNHALVQLPSLGTLAILRGARHRAAAKNTLIGFGDPLLGQLATSEAGIGSPARDVVGAATQGTMADGAQLRQLARLPGTRDELDALRVALGASEKALYVAADATERNVRSLDLSTSRVISFATHGLKAGEVGVAEPGLVLTPPSMPSAADDGLLTASEITGLKLNAEWVILSACNTAAGDGIGQPALSGLARAFFFAGARSLLATHWPVRDDVAAEITVGAVSMQKATSGMNRAQALQRAMKNIRNDTRDPSRAFPSAWAPFVLVGEAG